MIAEPTDDTERFRAYAIARLDEAMEALVNDGADLDVLAPLELALMAANLWFACPQPFTLDPTDVIEYVDEPAPACVCPADLVARGGFRSGCPVHA